MSSVTGINDTRIEIAERGINGPTQEPVEVAARSRIADPTRQNSGCKTHRDSGFFWRRELKDFFPHQEPREVHSTVEAGFR
jgi:hypothetical protein